MRRAAVLACGVCLLAACAKPHHVPVIVVPPLSAAEVCGEQVTPPQHATLIVKLSEPDGSPPARAEVRIEPCCEKTCAARQTDQEGRVVLEACPTARTNDVILSVDTNPRWYTYTPPRSIRVCTALQEVSIPLERHPSATAATTTTAAPAPAPAAPTTAPTVAVSR